MSNIYIHVPETVLSGKVSVIDSLINNAFINIGTLLIREKYARQSEQWRLDRPVNPKGVYRIPVC